MSLLKWFICFSEFHVNVELSCKHLFQESQIQASFQTHQLYIHWTVSSTKLEVSL